MRTLATALFACALFAIATRADAQVAESSSDASSPGIPGLYCAGCEKPPRVRVLPRLGVPLVLGGAFGRIDGDAARAFAIGVRPELTIGRVSEREQVPGRVHVGAYLEGLATIGTPKSALFGGGATVAVTTGEVTGVSLSAGAFARHIEGAFHAGGAASLFAGVWMPSDAIVLVPSLGVRVDARFAGEAERSIAVSLQVDPIVVAMMVVGLAS